MEVKGEINIAPNYQKEDYLELKLTINSDIQSWEKAVEILKDRIYGRYLNQIALLSADINANGFTIMALNCLLIETLYQFKAGKNQSQRNKEEYLKFLKSEFPTEFDTYEKAKRFYENIRCGILHSAQTKGNSRLSDRDDFVVKIENDALIVSVPGVSNILKSSVLISNFDNVLSTISALYSL